MDRLVCAWLSHLCGDFLCDRGRPAFGPLGGGYLVYRSCGAVASIYLGVLLVLVNLGIYVIDYRAGLILTCFVVVYFAIVVSLLLYNKPIIMNELISFATQYGQIQRRLLKKKPFLKRICYSRPLIQVSDN